jgi:hypothetical protein
MAINKELSVKLKDYVKKNLFIEPYRAKGETFPKINNSIYSIYFKSNKNNSYLTIEDNKNPDKSLDLMISRYSADIQIDFEKIYNRGLYNKYKSWQYLIKNKELDLVEYLDMIKVFNISLENEKDFNPEVTYRINYRDTVNNSEDGREYKKTIRDEYIYISESNDKVIFRAVNENYYDIFDEDTQIRKVFDNKDEAEKFLFISLLEFMHFNNADADVTESCTIDEFKKCKTIDDMLHLYKQFIQIREMIDI